MLETNVDIYLPRDACRLDDLSCDVRRRFASFLSCGFPRLMYAFMESWVDVATTVVATLGVGFAESFVLASLGSCTQNIKSLLGVAMTGLGTLGVGFPTSCLVTSPGSYALYMESWAGFATIVIATLGFEKPASCLVASQAPCTL
jgi:hypothetical protein